MADLLMTKNEQLMRLLFFPDVLMSITVNTLHCRGLILGGDMPSPQTYIFSRCAHVQMRACVRCCFT